MSEDDTEEQGDAMKTLANALAPQILKKLLREVNWNEHIDLCSITDNIQEHLDIDSITSDVVSNIDLSELDIECYVDDRIGYVVDEEYIGQHIDVEDHLDYYDIAQNLDHNDIAVEVQEYIEEVNVENAMIEAIETGCTTVDTMSYRVVKRARDSDEHGDEVVVLTTDEYNRLMNALNFVESTFNIPEPNSNTTQSVTNKLMEHPSHALTAFNMLQEYKVNVTKQLNYMSKPDLIVWAKHHGYNVDDSMTVREIRELVGV